jgi:NitT/TauT family transport system permease protein
MDRIFSPYLWAFYSTPRIILVPLIFLWLGINNNARLAIVIVSVIPQFAVVVMEGVKTTDATLLRAARSFGASRWDLFAKVIVPATTPFIGTGIRLAMLRALIGLYIGELFITADGLGSIISFARVRFDTARVFAVLLLFVLFAVAGLAVTRYLETRLTSWRAPAKL